MEGEHSILPRDLDLPDVALNFVDNIEDVLGRLNNRDNIVLRNVLGNSETAAVHTFSFVFGLNLYVLAALLFWIFLRGPPSLKKQDEEPNPARKAEEEKNGNHYLIHRGIPD
jgi:hypothetical protein